MPISGYFDTPFAADGDLTSVPDAVQPSGSVSYAQGWGPYYAQDPTINPSTALFIDRAQTNQMFNDVTTALQQLQQNSVPPFITSAMNGGSPYSYGKGVRVILTGTIYESNTAANTDTPPSSKWDAVPVSAGVLFSGGTSGGSANAQTVSSAAGNWTNTATNIITWISGFSVTGASTLSVDSQTAKAIKLRTPGGLVDTATGDIIANQQYMAIYDGTLLELLTPALPQASLIFQSIKVTKFTSNGTWTVDTNNLFSIVEQVGGGGGGGGAVNSANNAAGGGAAGGYLKALLTKAQASTSQSVTIGAAGAGGAAGSNNGTSGGTTSLGSLLSCTGGTYGQCEASPGSNGYGIGGTGGTPTVSTGTSMLTVTGQNGGYGGSNFIAVGGVGASNPLGSGGAQVAGGIDIAGVAATGYGAGGGGAINGIGSDNNAGGNGTAGVIIITEFLG